MGTQFWWFYDVLTLTIAVGIVYLAVAKGFNKMIFQLIGTILAFVVGIFGSNALAPFAYERIYQDNIINNVQQVLEEQSVYDTMAQRARQTDVAFPGDDDSTALQSMNAQETVPEWYIAALGDAVQLLLDPVLSPQNDLTIAQVFAENEALQQEFRSSLNEESKLAAAVALEREYYRAGYEQLVRMALFLILELVVVVIVSVIANMTSSLEEIMHIRRCNRLLGFVVGVLEAASALLTLVVAVKLLVDGTSGQMLLFNEPTIEASRLFQLLYEIL